VLNVFQIQSWSVIRAEQDSCGSYRASHITITRQLCTECFRYTAGLIPRKESFLHFRDIPNAHTINYVRYVLEIELVLFYVEGNHVS
jgi:hypothetical protein